MTQELDLSHRSQHEKKVSIMPPMNSPRGVIFLAGYPRSGTTWFANLLNAHSKVIYRHEIIGRNFHIFGDELFNALKYHNGLSDSEFYDVVSRIAEARIDTDKPPFFQKSERLLRYKDIHYYAWLATKLMPVFSPIYKNLFSVRNTDDFYFLIKETRSTVNMDSMIDGLRPRLIMFLMRHPCGAISSHLKKAPSGSDVQSTMNIRVEWVDNNSGAPYLKCLSLTERTISEMSSAEYLAIQWRVYYDDLLRFSKRFNNAKFLSYEYFVENTKAGVSDLLGLLGLDYENNVVEFIEESSGMKKENKLLIQKDAGEEYFSVYRNQSFDHNHWLKSLSSSDIDCINKHTSSTFEEISALIKSQ